MKTPEAETNNETFFCEQCGTEKSGDPHSFADESTVCGECYAAIEKDMQDSFASLYKDEA
jgi:protein-arginine kinase activator protein McsA